MNDIDRAIVSARKSLLVAADELARDEKVWNVEVRILRLYAAGLRDSERSLGAVITRAIEYVQCCLELVRADHRGEHDSSASLGGALEALLVLADSFVDWEFYR